MTDSLYPVMRDPVLVSSSPLPHPHPTHPRPPKKKKSTSFALRKQDVIIKTHYNPQTASLPTRIRRSIYNLLKVRRLGRYAKFPDYIAQDIRIKLTNMHATFFWRWGQSHNWPWSLLARNENKTCALNWSGVKAGWKPESYYRRRVGCQN